MGFHGEEGAAQHIGAARTSAHGGDATFQGPAHPQLQGVEAVDASEVSGHNVPHLVVVVAFKAHAIVVQAQMAVGINKAGVEAQTLGVQLFFAGGGELGANGLDDGAVDQDIPHVGLGVNGVVDLCMFD